MIMFLLSEHSCLIDLLVWLTGNDGLFHQYSVAQSLKSLEITGLDKGQWIYTSTKAGSKYV